MDEAGGSGSDADPDARRAPDREHDVGKREQPARNDVAESGASARSLTVAVVLIEAVWLVAILAGLVWLIARVV